MFQKLSPGTNPSRVTGCPTNIRESRFPEHQFHDFAIEGDAIEAAVVRGEVGVYEAHFFAEVNRAPTDDFAILDS